MKNKWVIKIVEEGNFIYVGEKVDREVCEMKIMNLAAADAFREEIFPKGLSESRQRDLELFRKFVVDDHVNFMAKNY